MKYMLVCTNTRGIQLSTEANINSQTRQFLTKLKKSFLKSTVKLYNSNFHKYLTLL